MECNNSRDKGCQHNIQQLTSRDLMRLLICEISYNLLQRCQTENYKLSKVARSDPFRLLISKHAPKEHVLESLLHASAANKRYDHKYWSHKECLSKMS